jgi:hypothetical protein
VLPTDRLAEVAAARLVSSTRSDLELVLSRGRPLLASPDLAAAFLDAGESAISVHLDGNPRWVAERVIAPWAHAGLSEPGLRVEPS